jgi:hypothetical protein
MVGNFATLRDGHILTAYASNDWAGADLSDKSGFGVVSIDLRIVAHSSKVE